MSDEDAQYQQWRSRLPKELQYEGDYDLKGFWRENPNFSTSKGEHLTDKFKLPNHPTFSDQSQYYNDQTKHLGGTWQKNDYNGWSFIPNDARFKKPIVEDVAGRPVEEEKPKMKVTEAIDKMRSDGYSEDEIFKAIASKPEMVERYRAEKQDALLSRKLPEGMEDLTGQAKRMSEETGPSAKNAAVDFARGANAVYGRMANAAMPGGTYNSLMKAAGGNVSDQADLPMPLRVASDAAGMVASPGNMAGGVLGGKIASKLMGAPPAVAAMRTAMGAEPAATGTMQTIGRFLTNTAGKAVGGGAAGTTGQAIDEAAGGFRPGWGKRTIGAGLLGTALGAGGGAAEEIGSGLQNSKGVRARNYAALGVDEARAIVAKGEPPVGSEGYRDYEAARDVLKSPQGGQAARLGLDVMARDPGVASAYAQADRAARPLPAGAAGPAPPPIDVTDLYHELTGIGPGGRPVMRSPEVEAQMGKHAALMERFGARMAPGGRILMPPDRVNDFKQVIGKKGAWSNVEGVTASDFAGADALARRANARFYGEADRLKTQQEIARERSRVSMGLPEEPLSPARETADAHKLETYMQPKIHTGMHGGITNNILSNAQALSGTAPVQSIARFLSGAGQQVAQPQLAPAASQALQNWVTQKQRDSAIIDTIFSKKKPDDGQQQEAQNGVRQ